MRPTETEIPDKRYFRIGEVSALSGLETYVLRYWETEFPEIKPVRSRAGQRLYRKKEPNSISKPVIKWLTFATTIPSPSPWKNSGKNSWPSGTC
jgi:hypothetical protein